MDWKEYQEKVADFFRQIGAVAETNVTVKGARGIHDVDVLVTFSLWGQNLTWVCECKFWKTSIPKEKILTLYQITQDIGADRGFLFSEKGFQSGAIRAITNTNITLTSLGEILLTAKEELFHITLVKYLKKINSLKEQEKSLWVDDLFTNNTFKNIEFDEVLDLDGALLFLSLAIQKALDKKFPILLNTYKRETLSCKNEEELLANLEIELNEIEQKILDLISIADISKKEIVIAKEEFISLVRDLIFAGEAALFPKPDLNFEELRLVALSKMRQVGKSSETLKEISRGTIKKQLHEIMRLLIDTIYLYLTQEEIKSDLWNDAKTSVFGKLTQMHESIVL